MRTLLCLLALSATASADVRYRIDASARQSPPGPTAVTVDIDAAPSPLVLVFASWLPGAYELRWFGRDVEALSAHADSTLNVERVSPERFLVTGHRAGAHVQVTYRITAGLLSDDGAEVSAAHVYANPAALLPMVSGREQTPITLSVTGLPSTWTRVCSLPSEGDSYRASGWAQLADALFEASADLQTETRTVAGARVTVALHAEARTHARKSLSVIAGLVERLLPVETELAGPVPFSRYLLLVHETDRPGHSVGLEHADATSILVPEAYDALGPELNHMIAHELFHAWNARRLVPTELTTWTPETPQQSRSLWISEGLTEYASLVAQVRAGLMNRAQLADSLSETLTRTRRAEIGLSLETLSQLAFAAPRALYGDDDAYYAVGSAVSLVLVGKLGAQGLPSLMKALLPPLGAPARTIDRASLGRALDTLSPAQPLSPLLDELAARPLSFDAITTSLVALGLKLALAPPSPDVEILAEGRPPVVKLVDAGGAFARAGVHAGDTILRLDGQPCTLARLAQLATAAPTRHVMDATRAGIPLELVLQPRQTLGAVRVDPASLDGLFPR